MPITFYLDRFAVIERLLPGFERDVGFLPRRLAAFVPPAPRHLAEIVDRAHLIDLDLKDRFDGRLDLRLGRVLIHAEGQKLPTVLRLLFRDQSLLRNDRRLDNVPHSSHRFYAASSVASVCALASSFALSALPCASRFGSSNAVNSSTAARESTSLS